jgi:uncharacterized ParB-like nuclease family protein
VCVCMKSELAPHLQHLYCDIIILKASGTTFFFVFFGCYQYDEIAHTNIHDKFASFL